MIKLWLKNIRQRAGKVFPLKVKLSYILGDYFLDDKLLNRSP